MTQLTPHAVTSAFLGSAATAALLDQGEPFATIFDPKADNPVPDSELAALRSRYANFESVNEITKICRNTFGCEPESVLAKSDDAAHANEHLIYFVVPRGSHKEYVCRIYTGGQPDWYMLVESLLYGEMRSRGVAAPEAVAVHMRTREQPYDYIVLEKIGVQTMEARLAANNDDAELLAERAGEYLGRIHQIPTSAIRGNGYFSIGAIAQGDLRALNQTWEDAVNVGVEDTLRYLREQEIIDQSFCDAIRAALHNHRGLALSEQRCFLHGDYYNANILLTQDAQIAGAVDLSQARIGDPAFDIAFWSTYYSAEQKQAFSRGYQRSGPTIDNLEEKIAYYGLRILLSKAKLRKRYGTGSIPKAIAGMQQFLSELH